MAILLLGFYIIKPFLLALLTGVIIAYLSYPLYEKSLKYVKNKNFASFIVTISIVLLLAVLLTIVLGLILKEAISTYNSLGQTELNQSSLKTNFLKIVCKDENWLSCKSTKLFDTILPGNEVDYYLNITIKKITGFIIDNVKKFLVSIPSMLLNFFVMLFVIYYLLKDGESVIKRIKKILPLKEAHKHRVLERLHEIISALFYGNISIAILQGILGIIGFLIFGVSSPILWGFIMMVFAFIPYVGTALIWLPAALNLIFSGYLENNNSATIRGIMLIAYGIFVISSVDNVLKPKLIGVKAKIHPVFVLLGVLGGLSMFGFIGLILGPMVLALLMTIVDIYEEENF